MVPDRDAIGRLRRLGEVQDLREQAAAVQLGKAQLQSLASRALWQDATGREAELAGKFRRMLQSGGFACGAYADALDLLHAHTAETQFRLAELREAEAQQAMADANFLTAKAAAGLVQQNLARSARQFQRKTIDRQEREGCDLYNMRLGEHGR